jgi:tRNA threonylcarbamoyladenosine biosynthesis protein TsaE
VSQWAIYVEGEDAMVAMGRALGSAMVAGVLSLQGNLGAGKTTLCRGILRSRGYEGAVKSPTYTLVEPYHLPAGDVFHFDLYRLNDPEELEFMGIRDYFRPGNFCIIEWPERGEGILPESDLAIAIRVENQGRVLELQTSSNKGEEALSRLKNATENN